MFVEAESGQYYGYIIYMLLHSAALVAINIILPDPIEWMQNMK